MENTTEIKQENEQVKEQATLLEEVDNYEPNTTLNIADLDYFTVFEPIETRVKKEGTDDEYKVKVLIRDEQEYRVPWTVIGDIKLLRKDNPKLTAFNVIKSGAGREGTKYNTIPHISGM